MALDPNQYSKLVARGRAKAIGIPWSEEEAVAINAEKDPAKRQALIAKLRGETTKPSDSDTKASVSAVQKKEQKTPKTPKAPKTPKEPKESKE